MVTQKPKRLAQLVWWRTHKVLFILTILVFAIIGFLLYERVALYENRRNFQQARLAIDSVYADVVREVGVPDNHKSTDSCSRSYREFTGYGDTTCHLDTAYIYAVNDENQAESIYRKIQTSISVKSAEFKVIGTLSNSIKDEFVVTSYYHAASDNYLFRGLQCTANYVYDTPREISLTINDLAKKPFEITLGCYGPAKGIFYPLAP